MFKRSLIIIATLATAFPAYAETNWMDIGKSILNAQTKQAAPSATAPSTTTGAGLTNSTIAAGLKEALNISSKKVVEQLGKSGGFDLDPKIRIPLPAALQRADAMLKNVGMGSLTADLETRMNKAAEIATPKAKQLFVDSIKQMSVNDAKTILSSQQDAATQYLRKTMGTKLAAEMKPIIASSLQEAGAVKAYDAVAGQYAKMPMVSGLKNNMNDYVTAKAMDGIFYYVAQEEAAIRQNPAKRTTELLKTVFGAK